MDTAMDLSDTRQNMIEQQIRTWEVLERRVLSLYGAVLRETFVADATMRDLAYGDMMLPTGCGQVMLEPKLEARMLQTLSPADDEDILHIGAGSGYFAALLGKLAKTVTTVEIFDELAKTAAARLRDFNNVTVRCEDGGGGVSDGKLYDAIVLTGSVPTVAAGFFRSLKIGGRLVAVTGRPPIMTLAKIEKRGDDIFVKRDILETCIPPLINAPAPRRFSF